MSTLAPLYTSVKPLQLSRHWETQDGTGHHMRSILRRLSSESTDQPSPIRCFSYAHSFHAPETDVYDRGYQGVHNPESLGSTGTSALLKRWLYPVSSCRYRTPDALVRTHLLRRRGSITEGADYRVIVITSGC